MNKYLIYGKDTFVYCYLGEKRVFFYNNYGGGVADIDGRPLTPNCFHKVDFVHDDYPAYHEGLVRIEYQRKVGFLDTEGKVVIPFVFSKATNFKNGKAVVIYDDQLLTINTEGNVLSKQFCDPELKSDFKWMEFDTAYDNPSIKGSKEEAPSVDIALPRGTSFKRFEGDYIVAYKYIDGERRYGVLNKNNEEVVAFEFERIEPSNDGMILARTEYSPYQYKYFYIDTGFTSITEKRYDSATSFYDGFAVANDEVIDTNIRVVLSSLADCHPLEASGSYFSAKIRGKWKWGVIDIDGNIIIDFFYDKPVEEVPELDRFAQHVLEEIAKAKPLPRSLYLAAYEEQLKDTVEYENRLMSKKGRKQDWSIAVNGNISDRNWTVTFILCVFLGFYGGHQFYAKNSGVGVIYLFTAGLFFFGWISDIVSLLNGTFKDGDGNFIVRKKAQKND